MPDNQNTTQGLQYSIRTMAQDLERAKKEGLAGPVAAAIRAPSTPPPPPPIPKIKLPAETPIAPIVPPATTIPAPATPPVTTPQAPAPRMPSLPIPPIEPRRITAEPSVPTPPLAPAVLKPSIAPAAPEMPRHPGIVLPPIKLSRFRVPGIKILIIIGAIFLALASALGAGYWWFFVRQIPAPAPIVETPKEPKTRIAPQEPSLPTGIIATDQDIIIESGSKTSSPESVSLLANKITLGATDLSDNMLARVLMKYISQMEISYLSLKESLAILRIVLPDALSQNISEGEFLAFKKNNEARYGFAARVNDAAAMLDAINDWVKTTAIFYDVNGIYIGKLPQRPAEIKFNDETIGKFTIKYINLPDSSVTLSLALSQEDKLFILTTSQDMLTRTIGIKAAEIPPSEQKIMPYPSGTLIKASGDPKIYRIIDDKKLFIPTKSAFSGSGYKIADVVTVAVDVLAQFENVRYFKLKDDNKVYEIKYGAETRSTLNQSKCFVADISSISPSKIKIVTDAEFAKYPLGKCD